MFHEGKKELLFSLDGTSVAPSTPGQGLEVSGSIIGQGIHLQIPPDVFHRVEFRSIGRQEEGLEFCPPVNEAPYFYSSMRHEPVPDQDDGTIHLSQQLTKEADNRICVDVLIGMETKVQMNPIRTGVNTYGSNDGYLLVGARALKENRSLPATSPSTSDKRRHQQAALIHKDQERLQALCFFLMRGQSCLIQRCIFS
jgi:hypothetical protein